MRILVTDGHTRTALAAVRALGRGGHQVIVTSARLPSLASASRYAQRAARVPEVSEAPSRFVSELHDLVEEEGVQLVLPVSDAAMSTLLETCGLQLGSATIAGPPPEAYRSVTDKANLLRIARRLEIPAPATALAYSAEELSEAAESIGYPCVVKSHESVFKTDVGFGNADVVYLDGSEDLRSAEGRFPSSAYPLLVQQRIFGFGEGVFLLLHRGRRVAAFAHRRLREYPPTGGASTYRESVPLPPDLLAWSERLLDSVGWDGVAMVEFKRCRETGRAWLMEVNGRLWGSLQLALDAGVDFPGLIAAIAAGEPPSEPPTYQEGVRTRWLRGDLLYVLSRARHGPSTLRLDPGAQGAFRVAADSLRLWRPRERLEVCSLGDLGPFFFELRDWIGGRLGRN